MIHSHKTKIETFFGDGPKDEPRVFLWQLKDPTRGHRLVVFLAQNLTLLCNVFTAAVRADREENVEKI